MNAASKDGVSRETEAAVRGHWWIVSGKWGLEGEVESVIVIEVFRLPGNFRSSDDFIDQKNLRPPTAPTASTPPPLTSIRDFSPQPPLPTTPPLPPCPHNPTNTNPSPSSSPPRPLPLVRLHRRDHQQPSLPLHRQHWETRKFGVGGRKLT